MDDADREERAYTAALEELAASEQPPVELDPYRARLRAAGVVEVEGVLDVEVVRLTSLGTRIRATADEARQSSSEIAVRARRFRGYQPLEWASSTTPVRDALDELVAKVQQFDQLTRFRLAASDMRLAADAAAALIDAHENDGPARLYDRVIETGMVVAFVRPYLTSNEAGIGEKWWPKGDDRELFDELVELRHEYHAHAAHTPRRRLEFTSDLLGLKGRTRVSESWEELRPDRLRAIEELATRQAALLDEQAEALDRELFGPKDSDD